MQVRARDDLTAEDAARAAPPGRRGESAPAANVAALLQLQRLAGNRAVGVVVQRDRTEPADPAVDDRDAGVPLPGGVPAAPGPAPRLNTPPPLPGPGDRASVSNAPPVAPAGPLRGPAPEPGSTPPAAAAGSTITFGQDWSGFFTAVEDPLNLFRGSMEALRPIPAVGWAAGLAADTANTYQDLQAVQKVNAPFTGAVIVLRDGCMIVNNVLGSLASYDQWVQDAATASVVGAEVDAVTMPLHEVIKGSKIWFDGVQLGLDALITGAAAYNASNAPAGSEELNNWNDILTNYEANFLGDALTTTIDAVDLATAGFANGENLKGVTKAIYNVFLTGKEFKKAILAVLQGWFGVVGGNAPLMPRSSGKPAPVQREVADLDGIGDAAADTGVELMSGAILAELGQMRAAYAVGDLLIGGASTVIGDLTTQLNQTATNLLDGQDPFQLVKANSQEMVARMQGSIGELAQMRLFAGTADEKAGYLIRLSDDLLGTLDRTVIPQIHVDRMEDDGIIASVVNAGSDLADSGLQVVLGQVRSAFDSAKESARAPVLQIRGNADEIAKFAQFLQQHTQQAIQLLEGKIASFGVGLSKCESFTDLVNLLLRQITEALGLGEGVSIEDIQREWREIPAMLDEAEVWARGLRRVGTSDAPAAEPGGPVADVPQPPADEDGAAA